MDPSANIARQRELADGIIAVIDRGDGEGIDRDAVVELAADLAEHVRALDEWRTKGGFDPYVGEETITKSSVVEALRDARRKDSAADAVEYVSDLVGWVADDDPVLKREAVEDLVKYLNEGVTPVDAIGRMGFDPDEMSTEDECLALDDPDNDVIDPLVGFFARRTNGVWEVVSYEDHREETRDGA